MISDQAQLGTLQVQDRDPVSGCYPQGRWKEGGWKGIRGVRGSVRSESAEAKDPCFCEEIFFFKVKNTTDAMLILSIALLVSAVCGGSAQILAPFGPFPPPFPQPPFFTVFVFPPVTLQVKAGGGLRASIPGTKFQLYRVLFLLCMVK